MDSESSGASSVEGLPRLPPGRHGLDRSFVIKNQRDRLTAGIIAVVAKHGYADSTITQICAEAGLSRRTFYSYFGGKEDCYLDAVGRITGYLSTALRETEQNEDDWSAAVRGRLATMLEIFSANPNLVRFGWIAPFRAGQVLLDVYYRNIDQILDLLTEGRPDPITREPPALIQQSVVGGMMALIALRIESDDPPQLTELLPDLVELLLVQYVGRETAIGAAAGSL